MRCAVSSPSPGLPFSVPSRLASLHARSAPSHNSPWPEPRANAFSNRAHRAGSNAGASAVCRSVNKPCGVRTGSSAIMTVRRTIPSGISATMAASRAPHRESYRYPLSGYDAPKMTTVDISFCGCRQKNHRHRRHPQNAGFAVLFRMVAKWRAAADEDGHYSFAVAL